eukprot:TRINITY_DN2570_c0_g1_i1.p1 TRINITY_DN2570_c0_g1~~TRINITY_DN2570_c0_g1_i1.p1  ORF type:complete len:353 (-),score=39.91 TRINITY_DN2570_c0_g1_i1:1117-2028(-)
MGKGGTKFIGEAKSVRHGRKRKGYSFRELKKNMAKFISTGEHAAVLEAENENKFDVEILPLPMWLLSRPHVFIEFTLEKEFLGRIVFELFDDYVSAIVSSFQSRCSARSPQTIKGTLVHRLLTGFALFGGANSSGTWISAMNKDLRHVEAGTISISRAGDEFAITFSKAHALDSAYQVVGVVRDGSNILPRLSQIETTPDDQPVGRLYISDCGQLDGQTEIRKGMFGGLSSQQSNTQQQLELGDQLQLVRTEIKDSISIGMQNNQKQQYSQVDHVQQGKRKKRKQQFQQLLLQDDDSENSDGQ